LGRGKVVFRYFKPTKTVFQPLDTLRQLQREALIDDELRNVDKQLWNEDLKPADYIFQWNNLKDWKNLTNFAYRKQIGICSDLSGKKDIKGLKSSKIRQKR